MSRFIALIDMDCFYAQVDEREKPELKGKPLVVCQFSKVNNGMAIAVNYQARIFGVKRGMTASEARTFCPHINVSMVPKMADIDKADLSRYRSASDEVFAVLNSVPKLLVEKGSVDEAYIDLTRLIDERINAIGADSILDDAIKNASLIYANTFIATGTDLEPSYNRSEVFDNWLTTDCRTDLFQLKLAIAARIVEELRREIKSQTQFQCSAGISTSKTLSKLASSRHKPGNQTIILQKFLSEIYGQTPIPSVRNFGGKLGQNLMERFGIKTMGDLSLIPYSEILNYFPGDALWITKLLEGEDDEPIRAGNIPQSIAVGKNFFGPNALKSLPLIRKWVDGLLAELLKRLCADKAKYQRFAQNLSIYVTFSPKEGQLKRTFKITKSHYTLSAMSGIVWKFISSHNKETTKDLWHPPIENIHIAAGRFAEGLDRTMKEITSFFAIVKKSKSTDDDDDIIVLNVDDAAAENRPPECSNDNCSRSEKDANGSEIIPSNHGSGKNVSKKKQMSIESSSQSRSQQSSPFFAIVSRSRSRSDGDDVIFLRVDDNDADPRPTCSRDNFRSIKAAKRRERPNGKDVVPSDQSSSITVLQEKQVGIRSNNQHKNNKTGIRGKGRKITAKSSKLRTTTSANNKITSYFHPKHKPNCILID